MRAALLSCGPSLTRYLPNPNVYLWVVGVNRAATAHRCDWWSAMDSPFIREHADKVVGDPLLWTLTETRQSLSRKGLAFDGLDYCRANNKFGGDIKTWGHYSAIAALWLAGHVMGMKHIDVFGVDMAGENDWDGVKWKYARRPASRWEREAELWQATVEALKDEGVEVHRYGIDDGRTSQ